MKQFELTFLLTALMSMVGVKAFAYDIAVENEDGKIIYYNFINGNQELEVTNYSVANDYTEKIVIPEAVEYKGRSYKVTKIRERAFYEETRLESIVIPNSVRYIGKEIFRGCSRLQSVTLSENLQTIKSKMFYECSALTEIHITSSVKTIEDNAFFGCKNLQTVHFPESLVKIEGGAFGGCEKLESINLPESVIDIGGAFTGTKWYEDQQDGLIYIGKVAYKYKGKMPDDTTQINIKEGTLAIASGAFDVLYSNERHFGLTTITIPNTVKIIGSNAFSGCPSLSDINIPESVVSIGEYAFGSNNDTFYTTWYKNQPDGLVYAGKVAYRYKGSMPKDTHIELADGTLAIANGAFKNNKNLSSIRIPETLKRVGSDAFKDCSGLSSLMLPKDIEEIGSEAFSGCENVKRLILNANTTIGKGFITYLDFLELVGSEAFLNGEPPFDADLLSKIDSIVVPQPAYQHLRESNVWENSNHIFLRGNDKKLFVGIKNDYHRDLTINGDNSNLVLVPCEEKAVIRRTPNSSPELYVLINGESEILTEENQEMKIKPLSFHSHLCNVVYAIDRNMSGENDYTITMTSSGTLLSQIGRNNLEKVKRLKIIGDINGTDILAIRKMVSLEELDLSQSNIVNGGSSYIDDYTTSSNEIGDYFFKDITNLIVLHLPESGTRIKRNAFDGCTKLQEITISGSFTGIDENAFSNSGIKKVVFKESKESIYIDKTAFSNNSISYLELNRDFKTSLSSYDSYYIFGNNGALKILTIDGQATKIDSYVFTECNSLSSLTIGSKVEWIGNKNFLNSMSLETVIFKDSENEIELSGAWSTSYTQGFGFFGNSPIKKLYCGRNISNRYGTFMDLTKLQDLTISENVSKIVRGQFKGCIGLNTVTLPNSISFIGDNAFADCGNLLELKMPNRLEDIGSEAFSNCGSLKDIEIPSTVKSIGSKAFYGCSAVASINIGNNVSYIYSETFANCSSLKEVRLGEKITNIGNDAFIGCNNIKTLYSWNPTPPTVSSTSLSGINRKACTLYVPKGSGDIYWLHPEWELFFDIKEVEASNVNTIKNDSVTINYYGLDGQQTIFPRKGINIIKKSDGTLHKVIVK